METLPQRATVIEVGPRDGLQIEPGCFPTARKIQLIDALTAAGIREMEVTSFVHLRLVPQMSDAAEVLRGMTRRPGVRTAVLVPNARGALRALECELDEIRLSVVSTETYSKKNWNMSIAESQAALAEVVGLVRGTGRPIRLVGCVAAAFGCPYEGDVPEERVLGLIDWYLGLGADGINIADSTGMANPRQVRRIMTRIVDRWPGTEFTLHLHDTRGMGLANVVAGLQAGVSRFDAAIGGLGGCPFAPLGTGNICTEDTVHMLHEMGIETGIDLDGLIAAANLAERLVGRRLPGNVYRAGKRSDLDRGR